jgi:hypothetical protein
MEVKVGRRDFCESCLADLHCCLNCRFHDPGAHNECRENISAWVRLKDASNFCAHFTFRVTAEDTGAAEAAAKARLEALFSKLK